jgi:hypothetical protein
VDQAVFYHRDKGKNVLIIVLVHVDDCSIIASTQPLIDCFKMEIKKHVDITDLGALHWILGIEVKHDRKEKKILLSQRTYIDSSLDTAPVQPRRSQTHFHTDGSRDQTHQRPVTIVDG